MQACATAGLSLCSDGRQVLPALGLAWSSCIGQRLFLARVQRPDPAGGTLRQLRIVYSPFLPQVPFNFMSQGAAKSHWQHQHECTSMCFLW
jgi:hypothetical protein